jgi:hypothetical protein
MSRLDALQRALAIEHQVIYGYGVVGAHLTGSRAANRLRPSESQTQQRLDQHLELRDRIAALVRAAGGSPVAGAAAYDLPFPVTGPSSAARLGWQLETSVAAAAYDVIAAGGPNSKERELMIDALTTAADWESRWSMRSFGAAYAVAFPGRPGQPS